MNKAIQKLSRKSLEALIEAFEYISSPLNPDEILNSLEAELSDRGVKILKGVTLNGVKGSRIAVTDRGKIEFVKFINASGAHADRIAHKFGLAFNYRIIPFKGLYKKLTKEKANLVRGNIYPVPDIRNPFLGIHFTKIHDSTVYVGPTATPAFGRENYGIFDDIGFETLKILYRDFSLFISNAKFRNTAFTEVRKYFKKKFYEDVKDMIEGVGIEDLLPSNKVGIRPQLIDVNKKELVMDFLVIKDSNTIHILNAISPAFTSAFAFAEFIIKEYFMEKNNGKLV